ncbi:hypothetical protein FVE85_5608 [Porphyridium purpureum]|uniref:Uncharacterized protein n=1 Tax=Porphyridium purpureum TaxID=35688 RepID=A0A5J4Z573_PORPP|nr:hypothetical protein FVE85_5608 [Porphyridium purpureum]|eukprot:POR8932..scf295_1
MFPMLFDEAWLRTHATSPAGYLAGRPELLVEVPRRVPFAELKHASNECLNNVLGFKGKHPLPQPSFNGSDGWALKISSAIFQEPRAHWIFFVLPLVNHVRRARLSGGPVFLLVNNLDTSGIKGHHKSVLWERKILVYITSQLDGIIYLRDAEHNARLEPKLPACTRTVGVPSKLPSSMINRDDYLYARRILSRFAQRPLYQHCRERRLHKPVVWILDRRIWSRRLRNRADIEMLVREEMGDDVEIRVFDNPNTDCENYIKGFANCNDAHPVYLAQDYPFFHASHRSERANDTAGSADSIATTDKSVSWSPSSSLPLPAQSDFDYDAALFNNITFLIAVHGGGLMNEWLLPEGSVAIEIYPYGVMDTSYRQLYANTNASGLYHLMYHDKNDSQARQAFGSVRAGDLWNSANRGKVKGLSVEVSIRKMRWAIRHSYELWRNSCSLATDWGIN